MRLLVQYLHRHLFIPRAAVCHIAESTAYSEWTRDTFHSYKEAGSNARMRHQVQWSTGHHTALAEGCYLLKTRVKETSHSYPGSHTCRPSYTSELGRRPRQTAR